MAVSENRTDAFGAAESVVTLRVSTTFPSRSRNSTASVYALAARERFSISPLKSAPAARRSNRVTRTCCADFGEMVHGILAAFHDEVPRVADLGQGAAIERLQALSHERFAQAMERNFLDRAWLARWMAGIPAYVGWQLGREADGWCVRESEVDRLLTVDTPAGRTVQLRGRLDRIDGRPDGAGGWSLSVVDYKAQSVEGLRKRAADPAEHVQLPSYVLLAGTAAVETLFLSIHGDAVTPLPGRGDPQAAARANLERLARLADRIHDGVPMPANGIATTCSHCEMRGVCRRDHWSAPEEAAGR